MTYIMSLLEGHIKVTVIKGLNWISLRYRTTIKYLNSFNGPISGPGFYAMDRIPWFVFNEL